MLNPEAAKSDHYDIYSGFSSNVRGWLVAYGVGLLALLLSQEDLRTTVISHDHGTAIAALLLAGAFSQLGASLLYKWTIGKLYLADDARGTLAAKHKNSCFHTFSLWLFEALWVEICFDLITMAAYIWATYRMFQILSCA